MPQIQPGPARAAFATAAVASGVRVDPRGRARAVRAGLLRGALPHPARRRTLGGAPRVAIAAVGEPHRSKPTILAEILPGAAATLSAEPGRRLRRGLLWGDQPSRALADPRLCRRGDLQPAHRAPVRDRAAVDPRSAPARGAATRVEPANDRAARGDSAARHRRSAAGHSLVLGRLRLLPDVHTGQPLLGEPVRRAPARSDRSRRSNRARRAKGRHTLVTREDPLARFALRRRGIGRARLRPRPARRRLHRICENEIFRAVSHRPLAASASMSSINQNRLTRSLSASNSEYDFFTFGPKVSYGATRISVAGSPQI